VHASASAAANAALSSDSIACISAAIRFFVSAKAAAASEFARAGTS
jgi:hypothetical protein